MRNIETGELVQCILGKNMRCLYDNPTGKNSIHAVMQHPLEDRQYIFQLISAKVRKEDSKKKNILRDSVTSISSSFSTQSS